MHDHNVTPIQPSEAVTPIGTPADDDARPGQSHSMWWMVACCAPMVVIALALLLGAFGSR